MLRNLVISVLLAFVAAGCASQEKKLYSKETSEKTFALAEEMYQKEQFSDAAEYYGDYMTYYPGGPMVRDALLRRLECGFKLVYGAESGFWSSSTSKGIEIVRNCLADYPYEDFVDSAYLKLAGYFFSAGEYENALLEYKTLIERYPESQWCGTAQMQIGMAYFNMYKGREYDPAPLTLARKNLLLFLAKYRNIDTENVQAVNEKLAAIAEKEAERDWYAADFYLHNNKVTPAMVYLRDIITVHGTTSWAEKAAEKIRELETDAGTGK